MSKWKASCDVTTTHTSGANTPLPCILDSRLKGTAQQNSIPIVEFYFPQRNATVDHLCVYIERLKTFPKWDRCLSRPGSLFLFAAMIGNPSHLTSYILDTITVLYMFIMVNQVLKVLLVAFHLRDPHSNITTQRCNECLALLCWRGWTF